MKENEFRSNHKAIQERSDSGIRALLTDELELFRNLFRETNEFVNHLDSVSVESVMTLLNVRQSWIEELLMLESKRKAGVTRLENQAIRREITSIARSLVAIDAKLLDFLKIKRQEIVKDLSKLADNRNRNRRNRSLRYEEPTVIDIVQE